MKRVALLLLILLGSGCGRGVVPGQTPVVQKQALQTRTFYVIGDSLSAGYLLNPDAAYPVLVKKQLQAKYPQTQFELINDSIPGSETSSAMARMQKAVTLHPDVVLLELGANDGISQRAPKTIRDNLIASIRLAQENGIKVVLAGMLMPLHGFQYSLEFATVFRKVQAETNVVLIPFLLQGVAAKPELNLDDRIHPNEKGQAVVADTALPYIEQALFSESGK